MINMFPEDNESSLIEEYRELQEKYSELEEKYKDLSEKYTALLQEFEEVKNSKSKAGRKPNDEKWTAKYQAFARMKAEGCKREQIQSELNMSRATYFRYNKIYSGGGSIAELPKEMAPVEMPELIESPVSVMTEETPVEVPEKKEPENAPVMDAAIEESIKIVEEVLAKVQEVKAVPSEGLVLDPDTGEYVSPEGLKRRKKLAEIRARRAAEEELKRQQAELAASQATAEQEISDADQTVAEIATAEESVQKEAAADPQQAE